MYVDHALILGPGRVQRAGDPRVDAAAMFGIQVESITEFRVVHLRSDAAMGGLAEVADKLLTGAPGEWWMEVGEHRADGLVIETGLRPGVTDREAAELVRAAREIGVDIEAASMGHRFVIDAALETSAVTELSNRVLHNDVIERWTVGHLEPVFVGSAAGSRPTESVELADLDVDGLATVNRSRRLGLDPEEMIVIRDFFAGQNRVPTDAELEMLAQTWSEHCAHKTFGAEITVIDQAGRQVEVIDGLLNAYLRTATDTVNAPWVRSAFVDNAGIVAFDDEYDIALKAETHNHPSALEPFGGANTGVGGVVRDILGVSAKPIVVSDILCFGPEDLDPSELPDGVLHPKRIRDQVIAGIGDYGNKIGVPNTAGAIVHDPAYTTTPLVFAGCVGLLPTGSNPTRARAGDKIVVLGGAVGRDGVGGATFSSQTMQAETADLAGSSVQIGDPIVEKGLIDVIIAARDAQMYTAITDCGAGGLSSSVGEMAAVLGAEVDLALVPRKYSGLAPWEVWLSEAQERMVVATPNPEPLLELAALWGVGAATIGHFTGDGRLRVHDDQAPVIDLDCEFLHNGRPRRQMRAIRPSTDRSNRRSVEVDPREMTLRLLLHPNIRSNEAAVRCYDHEVQGGTVVRPYGGVSGDGPADGTTTVPVGTSGERAMVIGIGVNCVLGAIDAEAMAWHVIDEAVRNAIIGGANPHQLSLLDNFAWGDPTDESTLGTLAAACGACHDAAVAFGAPFVSGKDSLYNVFLGPDGHPDPVAPTLVITAVGICEAPDLVPLTGLVVPGDDVWLLGPSIGALGGSHLDRVLGDDLGGEVPRPEPGAVGRHHQLAAAISGGLVRSAHDASEGGLAVAASEWAHAGRLGLDLDLAMDPPTLFGEGPGRYLVEVTQADAAEFARLVPDARPIGRVVADLRVRLGEIEISLEDIRRAYVEGDLPADLLGAADGADR